MLPPKHKSLEVLARGMRVVIPRHPDRPAWLVLGLLVVLLATLLYRDDLFRLVGPPSQLDVYADHVDDRAEKIRHDAQVLGDWQWEAKKGGLVLKSGQHGEIIYHIRKEPDQDLNVRVGLHWNGLEEARIEISTDGVHYRVVGTNLEVSNRFVRLTPYVVGHPETWLRIAVSVAATGSTETYVALDWIEVVKIKNPIDLPYLPGIFLFIVMPLTAYAWVRLVQHQTAILYAGGLLALEALLTWLRPDWIAIGPSWRPPLEALNLHIYLGRPTVTIPWIWFAYIAGVIAALCVALLSKQWRRVQAATCGSFLVATIALGFVLRWEMLSAFQYNPLDPDAVGYRQIADHMQYLYDTQYREPFWIWTVKLWFLMVGSSDLNLRLLTVMLSLVVIVASYKFFKEYTGQSLLALLAVIPLAVNPYLIFMSVRGLRLELYIIAIIMLAYYTLVRDPRLREGRRITGLSIWGTVAVLHQFNSVAFVLPFWTYTFWQQNIRWKKLFVPLLVMVLLVTPHLIYNYEEFGDPFWGSINAHAKFYRNLEFVAVKDAGCQGCPTLEEWRRNNYAGAPVTTLQYVFGMHSLGEVISRTLSGYATLFLLPTTELWYQLGPKIAIVYYLYLLGLVFIMFSKFRELLLFPLLTINLLAFLVPLGMDARLVAHTAPFVSFMPIYGAWRLTACGLRLLNHLR